MTPDEFSEKKRISIGFVIWVGIICFTFGGTVTTLMGLKDFFIAEVSGLRADMEKEDRLIRGEIEKVNSRVDRKIKNHEAIYHKDH